MNILRKLKRAFLKRASQVEIIQEYVRRSPYPVILCGDFNDTPVSYTMGTLTNELKDALENLIKQDVKGLILDLRFNPGGLLSAAVEISDLFIESGKIVSTKGRNTDERTWEAHKAGTYKIGRAHV